jgi:hypothetical protein
MAWLDLGLFSAIHVKVALTLLGTVAFYGAMAVSSREPQPRRAFARVRKLRRPSAE